MVLPSAEKQSVYSTAPAHNIYIKIPSMEQIDLWENVSYKIRPSAKCVNKIQYKTFKKHVNRKKGNKNVNERSSFTLKHKITIGGLKYH